MKDTIHIDGREITLVSEHTKPKVFEFISTIVKKVAETDKYFRYFSKLEISIDSFKNDRASSLGYVSPQEFFSGDNIIHIHQGNLVMSVNDSGVLNSRRMAAAVEETLEHEIKHLWQLKVSKAAKAVHVSENRLKAVLRE